MVNKCCVETRCDLQATGTPRRIDSTAWSVIHEGEYDNQVERTVVNKKKQSTIHIKDFKFDFDVPDYGLTSLLTLLNDYRDCFTMSIHELYGAPISTYINIH